MPLEQSSVHPAVGDSPPHRVLDQLFAASLDVNRAMRLTEPGTEPARHLDSALSQLDHTVTTIMRAGLVWSLTDGPWLEHLAIDTIAALAAGPANNLAGYLSALARRTTDLPEVEVAAFVLDGAGDHLTVMVPDQVTVWDLCHLRPGPIWDACVTGQPQTAIDLTVDLRWPLFTKRATAAGYRAVHILPLRRRNLVLGTFVLFSATAGTLPPNGEVNRLAELATVGVLLHHADVIALSGPDLRR